jgi:hypothetical protein
LCISYPSLREYLSAVHSSACISVLRRRRQLWLIVRSSYRGIEECSVLRPDQSRGTIHSSPKYATISSDRGAEVVANPTGATVFHRPVYLGDEATQTSRTNFSEHTLNPPTSPRSLSVEFEYTLYTSSYIPLAEYRQFYCGEIRQMLIFLLSLYGTKAYHLPGHSIRIVAYHGNKLSLNPTSSPELKLRTGFRGCGTCFCNLLAEINNFGLGPVLLSCLVSELQKPPSPGLKPRTISRSFYCSEISFCFQGMSMPRLVHNGVSVLEL